MLTLAMMAAFYLGTPITAVAAYRVEGRVIGALLACLALLMFCVTAGVLWNSPWERKLIVTGIMLALTVILWSFTKKDY